ncbi:MAG: UvrD-helicase domain-containing protein [Saprospiraceae bacterium]
MPNDTMPQPPSPALNIELLSAGAGSGKTYTITGKLADLLRGDTRPSGIIATTFTRKAAAELQERVRVRLLEAGLTEAANALGSALIGTVHSVGTRLLQRFAFEAGVSPLVEIIADGDEQRLFNESLSQVLTEEKIELLNTLADRLGLTKTTFGEPFDWRRQIRELTDVARANNFSAEVLQKSKRLSWETFARFLPPAQATGAEIWNNRLLFHLENTAGALETNAADSTKTTKECALALRSFANQLRWRGELHWHEWVKIGKLAPGAKSRDLAAELQEFARSHTEHAGFHADIRQFIEAIFDVAIAALEEFEQYKKKRGLIDYTDMETYVSRLLRSQAVRDTLRAEIDLLLVDEFQDTSPIQLDIFLQISQLAKKSIWVGDPKQSIYGFRGADPALMQAIIEQTGGVRPENILRKSWRSRPDIVHAVNAIFVRAFPQLPPEQIALEPARTVDGEPSTVHRPPSTALMHWHFKSELDERKVPGAPWTENCIADQTRILLERGLAVQPKGSKTYRNVQPGDIAILCRSNKGCLDMAAALHRAGLKASIARAGLLETSEAQLVLACLKFLLSPANDLSLAEIRLLALGESLADIVDDRLVFEAKKLGVGGSNQPINQPTKWGRDNPFIQKLLDLRPHTADLSASEIVGLLLDELDLRRVALRFGNAEQRLDNLEMLRRFAFEYEDACTRLHSAASLGGFLLWLSNLEATEQDMQGSGENPDAVKVLTYHKSKGLEYPVTICHNLGQDLKEKVWGLNLVPETDTVDLDNILGNRWLRFWVNPYADQIRGTQLDENLRNSPEWATATAQALAEEARLLYVGLTRARDYLVFPTTGKPTKWLNRAFNNGDSDIPTLDPNADETPFYWDGQSVPIATELIYKPKDFPEAEADEPPARFHAERGGKRIFQSHRIDPYGEQSAAGEPKIGELLSFASPLEVSEEDAPNLHRALSAIFAADNLRYTPDQRLALVQKQLEIRALPLETIKPEPVAQHSGAFFMFLKNIFQPRKMERRLPLKTWQNQRLLELEIDFLLESEREISVLQIVQNPDSKRSPKQQAQQLGTWTGWARVALQAFFPGKPLRFFALLPAEGAAVELIQ